MDEKKAKESIEYVDSESQTDEAERLAIGQSDLLAEKDKELSEAQQQIEALESQLAKMSADSD